ncbi:hypothetical protein ACFFX0_16280 [Citricoccus parietis]|uniref:Uncharacterized protein n=1 Tax=Citricoccus parietis TaxID=592307 RepID=A0ABV5G188_9MICC
MCSRRAGWQHTAVGSTVDVPSDRTGCASPPRFPVQSLGTRRCGGGGSAGVRLDEVRQPRHGHHDHVPDHPVH